MYVNCLGDTILDTLASDMQTIKVRDKEGNITEIEVLDPLVTMDAEGNIIAAVVNKDPVHKNKLRLNWLDREAPGGYVIRTLAGKNPDSFNDIDRNEAVPENDITRKYKPEDEIILPPHSVSIITF
jgi:alpha-L-arabinofuranosidase